MQQTRRQWLMGTGGVLLTACGLAPALSAIAGKTQVVAFGGPAFGTYWRISLPLGASKARVRGAIEEIVHAVDWIMSPFRIGTESSRFNEIRSVGPIPVSRAFQAVVAESLRIANLTGGAFDPTVGPLVNRFGFGPITGNVRTSFTDITIGDGAISKSRPDVTIDLCGIAKGYALEKMADVVEELGFDAFVIELGGEVFARGSHPQGRPWRIAIEHPIAGADFAQRIVGLDGQALATSGDAANAFTVAGRRYSHIIDPRTAAPVDNRLASVSVIARSAMTADALATAFMALGPTKSAELAARHGIPTLMLLRDGENIREKAVAGFTKYLST